MRGVWWISVLVVLYGEPKIDAQGMLFPKWPVLGLEEIRVTSFFGWRKDPFSSARRQFHAGIDIATPLHTPITPVLPGKVVRAGKDDALGYYVRINHGSTLETVYGHLSRVVVKKGQIIYQRTVLGKSGQSGRVTGPHLHFGVYLDGKAVNPLLLLTLDQSIQQGEE